jgi:hypothetical protein
MIARVPGCLEYRMTVCLRSAQRASRPQRRISGAGIVTVFKFNMRSTPVPGRGSAAW